MATEVERLIASLEASTTKFERQMRKAMGITDTTAKKIEKRMSDVEKNVTRSFENIGDVVARGAGRAFGMAGIGVGAVGAAAGGIMIAREVIAASDAWINMRNRLEAAGVASSDVARRQKEIADIAIASRSPLEGVATLYARLTASSGQLGASSEDVRIATQATAQALKMYGANGSEAASAMVQLSQALASGVLRGDEFNSLNENAQPIIQAIAKEFGVASTELRAMAENGELVGSRVLKAIVAEAPNIQRAFEQSIPTVEGQLTNLHTAFQELIGVMTSTEKQGGILARTMGWLAVNLRDVADSARAAQAAQRGAVLEGPATTQAYIDSLKTKLGDPNLSGSMRNALEERLRVEESRLKVAVKAKEAAEAENNALREANKGKALGSFDPPFTYSPFGGPGAPRSKPEGAMLSAKERGIGVGLNDYQRQIQTIREKTEVLRQEAQMVGHSAYETEKAKTAQELKNALDREGIKLTPQLAAEIEKTSAAYAEQKVRLDQLEEQLKKAKQQADEFRSATSDYMSSFAIDVKNAFQEGKSAAEAFGEATVNVLNKIADRMMQIAADNLVAMMFGQQGTTMGGLFGSAVGGFFGFGGVRAGGGSVGAGRAYTVGENGPETFVPTTPGTIIPRQSGAGFIMQGDTYHVSGVGEEAIARLRAEQEMRYQRLAQNLPKIIREHRGHGR